MGPRPETNTPIPTKFFCAGTAACVAEATTIPLDTAKVRLQIQGEGASLPKSQLKYRGMFGTMMTMSKEEGPRALYKGLVPGLHRQMAFASIRIGLYDSVKSFYIDILTQGDHISSQNVGLRILAGITTGGLAVSVAQPTDVVKVRMQAQKNKIYAGTFSAYRQIATTEGVRGLWKGIIPNVTRNSVTNAAELVSYDLIKEKILNMNLMRDSMPCHFVSAFLAGFVTTCIASPIDVVKTRFMNSPPKMYSGAINCAIKIYKEGGVSSFYKGFGPAFMRLGSWNIVMFVCFEQFKRLAMNVQNIPLINGKKQSY